MARGTTEESTPSSEEPGVFLSRLTDGVSRAVSLKTVLGLYTALVVVYVYLPILSLVVFSFNAGGLSFPFSHFTLSWYDAVLADQKLISSVVVSLRLALFTTVITTLLATAAALSFRYDFFGKQTVLKVFLLGIVIPGVTYGIGSLLLFNNLLNVSTGFWLAVPIEVVWTFPFGFIILLAGFPRNLAENEMAARVMGASKLTVYRKVILPQIGFTVLGTALFSFTLAYNEAARSQLVLGTTTTMPIYVINNTTQLAPTPKLFALGVLTTIVSTVLLVVAGVLVFFRRFFR